MSGEIFLRSDEPQGGTYRIYNCGDGCHVMAREDKTKDDYYVEDDFDY